MKLERIQISDFRQYHGSHTVRLAHDDAKNVTIFHGANGAGKTSLFAALNWCLYGEGVEGIGEIISKETVRQAEVGEEVITKVVVTFVHEGQRYHASRQLKGLKQSDGTVREKTDVELLLLRTRYDGQSSRVENPIGTINAILPSNVRTYFFFDGEKIENFARPEAEEQVRYAIYGVLNLRLLENAREHLDTVARDLRSDLRKIASGELKTLVAKDEELRLAEQGMVKRQDDLKREIAAAQKHISDVNQQLRDMDAAQALQKQHDILTNQLGERETELKALNERIRNQASQGYSLIIVDALKHAHALLDEKRQRGEIPSNIRQQFVLDLLAQKICVCGRSFSEHDDAHKHLSRLLSTAVPSSLEDDVVNTSANLLTLIESASKGRADLDTMMAERARLQDILGKLYLQRDDINQQMTGSQASEASLLAKKRDEYHNDILRNQENAARIEVQLEDTRKQIIEIDKQIAQARKSEQREIILSRKMHLAQESADRIGAVYENFAEQKRQQIEQRTREIFRSLAWKGGHFHDIRLTKEYSLQVIDRWEQQARPELSAGERQVLSLSFITAMARVAEREAPLVMDTPFGRLSSAHRESITARIPELASQLILFVTDEELRDQALANLKPRIGHEYMLRFDPETSCTTIEEVTA